MGELWGTVAYTAQPGLRARATKPRPASLPAALNSNEAFYRRSRFSGIRLGTLGLTCGPSVRLEHQVRDGVHPRTPRWASSWDPAQRRTKGGPSPAVRESGPSPAVEGPTGPNVESRGRLLSAFGPPQISSSIWRRFCQDAKNSNCRTSSDPAQRRTKGGTSPAVLLLPGRRADGTV